ncbi:MAG: 50S ribosomal protein L15 [Rhodospirillaceae bacterium]|nr:50S ribosomal protein L15 [Rhodospirillaceae bacterium]
MKLNELRDNPGASRERSRVGRGIGSGSGKTAGRGHKGQKSRSGVAIKGFEGGQMPLYRRLPKRGFNNKFSKKYAEVNVGQIQAAIDRGRLTVGEGFMDIKSLETAGLISGAPNGVRLLGNGDLTAKINIEVSGATAGAMKAFKKVGGEIKILQGTGKVAPERRDRSDSVSTGD